MKPKLAIVGRPNVGKSALFNRICKKRIAIVDEAEGITRDRLYAESDLFGFPFEVIDTGGIDPRSPDQFREEIRRQANIAIEEADTLVMVVDGKAGLTDLDAELASLLLKIGKPITLAVNKVDTYDKRDWVHNFHALGIANMVPISAIQGHQIAELLELAWEGFSAPSEDYPTFPGIKVSIVGRPNVGKSTLVNALLEEKRCCVSPIAGTTRDSVDIPIQADGEDYVLIDTAGIRRKKGEHEVVDKFAALRVERAIERSDLCLLIIDVEAGLTHQEKRIANTIEKAGKGCVILLNKWDRVKGFRMEHCIKALKDESPFLAHCPLFPISALNRRNLEKIFPAVKQVYASCTMRLSTHALNTLIEKAMQLNHPSMIQGKRLRVYFTTQVEVSPPTFVMFINYPDLMLGSYKRYLINQLRKKHSFTGAPLRLHLKKKVSRPFHPSRVPNTDFPE